MCKLCNTFLCLYTPHVPLMKEMLQPFKATDKKKKFFTTILLIFVQNK